MIQNRQRGTPGITDALPTATVTHALSKLRLDGDSIKVIGFLERSVVTLFPISH
jgi:hypothetical protein